jgi:hypothetical protein
MDELIALVTQKVGVTADQAKGVVNTVMDYLKTKLPAPVVAQIESALAGAEAQAGGLGGVAKKVGEFITGKK